MRIYTEVNFIWDDKQGKLVETSSKSFDYQGELALCLVYMSGGWFRDSQGNDYEIKLGYKTYTGMGKRYEWQYVVDQDGTVVWEAKESDNYWKIQDAIDNAKAGITGYSNTGELYAKASELDIPSEWAAAYKTTYGLTPSENAELDRKWASEYWVMDAEGRSAILKKAQVFGDAVNEGYWTEIEKELEFSDPNNPYADEAGSKDWYDWEDENNPSFDKDLWQKTTNPGLIAEGIQYELAGDPIPLGEGAEATKTTIETIMTDWAKIVDPTRPDAFQDALEDAVQDLGWAEEDIITAFNTLQEKFTELETDYTTDVEELTGERIVDPETGEVISEGTYTEGIRLAGKTKTEGLEGTVTTREEELEALREEAGGEIRVAEAKIGAAGFASTGVGKTAREALAGEIGEAAEDIDVEFGEEREIIKEDFVETTGRLRKEKNVSLGDYERERDRLANEAATGDWKTKTESYQRLLESYDALKGETGSYTLPGVTAPGFSTSGGIAAQAEADLTGIQADIESLIASTREIEGYEDWDPFSAGATDMAERTALYGLGEEYGWDPISKTFSTTYPEGLFDPTVQEIQYTPGETALGGLNLYDPEFRLPWEERTAPGGDPTKPGGQG